MSKQSLTIGILGGMGPAATVDIFSKIVRLTPAVKDEDHIRVIIDNNPKIPNRIAAYYGRGADPSPAMLASAQSLERAGADFIIMPCNTAHLFVKNFEKQLKVPFLSMVDTTIGYIRRKHPGVSKAGILGTTPTVESGLYRRLEEINISLVAPEKELQNNAVMEAIFGLQGIKAGSNSIIPRELLLVAAAQMARNGAEIILLACTELPIVMRSDDVAVPLLDLNLILAEAAVNKALGINAEA
jgi:aspartate racemase